ncbi:35454_t:CDS:2 [Gigaspora margarita]|uniref:35454_t:CDS:1 n=1 Tax=Gigaspora margarita TaxID=4874 RepID=A0ABN7WFW4_GIGMA|nr:35454_t:CDS:2 [Gigaspora margarita]
MPRKDHNNKMKQKLNIKLRSDDKNFYKNEIFKENFELENFKLEKLGTKIDSLNAKAKRLENNKISYQTENKELKEKLQCITNLYKDNKSVLERYYNVIQRTYSILQEVFNARQLASLCNEIKEVCEGSKVDSNIPTAEHSPVYNSFEDALMESEPKIEEIDTERSFPSLKETQPTSQEDENTKNANDQEFFSF